MSLTHAKLRQLFADYWEERDHKFIPPAPLVLKEDPTTLFTSSGMQPLVNYLAGETHPQGKKLYNIQPCIRTQDIEEVGDNRHMTFFEMMGNWSLGEYFKERQLFWIFEFYTKVVQLPLEKLYISVFEGNLEVPRDEESTKIWKQLGVPENHIFYYGVDKNWWSRSGRPDKMPAGEIGGPDSEVFYEFTNTPHDPKYGKTCHPNCDCGRFLEIGNSVFMQYRKSPDGKLEELPNKNVDFGGGFERLLAAINNDPDIFKADVFAEIIGTVHDVTGKEYEENQSQMRIIADHIKAAVFLIKDGVYPSNKEHGYVLRRLLRRAAIKLKFLQGSYDVKSFSLIAQSILNTYRDLYFGGENDEVAITTVIEDEINKFSRVLHNGIKEINKILFSGEKITGKVAFDLYQSDGVPLEIIEDIVRALGQTINHEEFEEEFEKHKELSRTASAGMFKGGLADHNEQTIRYHTATHLLHQTLFDVLGNEVRQEGSNITAERLRFDFSSPKKPEQEEIQKVETIINEKIVQSLPVNFQILSREEAFRVGARSFFKEKYPEMVKVYYIGDSLENAYSKEFCGGPHVTNTAQIGRISIYKLEKIGSNLYRIYAK